MSTRYRLSWQMPDAHTCDRPDSEWPQMPDAVWEALPWHTVTREADTVEELADQHRCLQQWAATREQPIRDVKLEGQQVGAWQPIT